MTFARNRAYNVGATKGNADCGSYAALAPICNGAT